jgi:hypothetical protein
MQSKYYQQNNGKVRASGKLLQLFREVFDTVSAEARSSSLHMPKGVIGRK